METRSKTATKKDVKNGLEVVRITPGASGCSPDKNPARTRKDRGQFKFINQTDEAVTLNPDRDIFEKGPSYTIPARGHETYTVDPLKVSEGDTVPYSIEGDNCLEQLDLPEGTAARFATIKPEMIID